MDSLKGLDGVPAYWYNPGNHSLERILNAGMKQEIIEQLPQVKLFTPTVAVIVYQSNDTVAVKCVGRVTMINAQFKDKYARAFLVMNGRYGDFCATIQTSHDVDFDVVYKNGGVKVTVKQKEVV